MNSNNPHNASSESEVMNQEATMYHHHAAHLLEQATSTEQNTRA